MTTATQFLLLVVLGLSLWIGGWMLLRPASFLQARRERAVFARGLIERVNQPTSLNLALLRVAGAIVIGTGVLAALLVLAQ